VRSIFEVLGDPIHIAEALFPCDESGFLKFGFAGRSRDRANLTSLQTGFVPFVDYLMEGFVPYDISAEPSADGLRIAIEKRGTNRDSAIDWFVTRYIESKGFTIRRRASS